MKNFEFKYKADRDYLLAVGFTEEKLENIIESAWKEDIDEFGFYIANKLTLYIHKNRILKKKPYKADDWNNLLQVTPINKGPWLVLIKSQDGTTRYEILDWFDNFNRWVDVGVIAFRSIPPYTINQALRAFEYED